MAGVAEELHAMLEHNEQIAGRGKGGQHGDTGAQPYPQEALTAARACIASLEGDRSEADAVVDERGRLGAEEAAATATNEAAARGGAATAASSSSSVVIYDAPPQVHAPVTWTASDDTQDPSGRAEGSGWFAGPRDTLVARCAAPCGAWWCRGGRRGRSSVGGLMAGRAGAGRGRGRLLARRIAYLVVVTGVVIGLHYGVVWAARSFTAGHSTLYAPGDW